MPDTKRALRKSCYFDSMHLMKVSAKLREQEKVVHAFVVMGTPNNKKIMADIGLMGPELEPAGPNDLMAALSAEDPDSLAAAWAVAEELLAKRTRTCGAASAYASIADAARARPGANLCIISLPGAHVYREARRALACGLNLLIFSDNVPLEQEREIKLMAREKRLLCMGPDCGVANVNGASFLVGSIARKGPIGVVGASGSGMQLVTAIADQEGVGISQAIGTGGRDLKDEVGGITTLMGLDVLEADPNTEIIVLVSRVPGEATLRRVLDRVALGTKKMVVCFIGCRRERIEAAGAVFAPDLERAATLAVDLAKNTPLRQGGLGGGRSGLESMAARESALLAPQQRWVRGLFCGGTFCDEAITLLTPLIGDIRSNSPLRPELRLEDSRRSVRHSIVDYGAEEFTLGRPHPVIDPEPRLEGFRREAADPETAVVLLDFILGPAVHPDPAGTMAAVISKARSEARAAGRHLAVVASVCGTERDPQDLHLQVQALSQAGVIVAATNAQAARLASAIVAGAGR